MRIDEFIALVCSEPERTTRLASPPIDMALLDQARAEGRGMRLSDLILAGPSELRVATHRHLLGQGAPEEAIAALRARFASYEFPNDVLGLVRRMNGIHLWANPESGRAYYGIAPIEEWTLARSIYGGRALRDEHVMISYQSDEADGVVLDLVKRRYVLLNVGGALYESIGSHVEELLDYVWRNRLTPRDGR